MPRQATASNPTKTTTPEATIKEALYEHLEYFGDLVIQSDGEDRIKYWNHFENVHALFKEKNVKFGRVYNRRKICRLVATLTAAILQMRGVDVDFHVDKQQQQIDDADENNKEVKKISESILNVSIAEWKSDHWDCFQKLLRSTANGLRRKDANGNISDGEDEEISDVQGSENVFTSQLEGLLQTIKMLRGVSPLRDSMMQVLSDDCDYEDNGRLPIDGEVMKQYWKTAQEEPDEAVKNVLLGIIQKPHNGKTLQLIPVGKLREKLKKKPLCLEDFHGTVNNILRSWGEKVFGGVGDGKGSSGVGGRKRGRLSSPLDTSPNPLKKKGSILDKKKSATSLGFDEDGDGDGSSGGDVKPVGTSMRYGGVALSQIQTRVEGIPEWYKNSRTQTKKYSGRRSWSDEEKQAIKDGILEFGWGKWAAIKDRHKSVLEERTSAQIKDCVRTMKRRGELVGIADNDE